MSSLIARTPDIMSGAYTIRGTRLTVTWLKRVRKYDRWSVSKIAKEYRLTKEQVRAALRFKRVSHE